MTVIFQMELVAKLTALGRSMGICAQEERLLLHPHAYQYVATALSPRQRHVTMETPTTGMVAAAHATLSRDGRV